MLRRAAGDGAAKDDLGRPALTPDLVIARNRATVFRPERTCLAGKVSYVNESGGAARAPCRGFSYVAARGFTLIEMLVVLMIIGVTLAMVSVNFTPDDRQVLESETRRLALLFEQARDEAVTSARAIAWSGDSTGYQFWRRNAEFKWATIIDEQIFRSRGLPTAVKLADLRINESKVGPNGRLIFSPSGFNAPFALALAAGSERLTITGDAGGRIRIAAATAKN